MDCRLSLRVIRQQRSILSQSHELAVCIRNEDDSFNLIYKDRSYTGCTLSEIATAVEVNAKSIGKAFVLHAVGRDIFELRAKLPDYSMVRDYTRCPRAAYLSRRASTSLSPYSACGAVLCQVHRLLRGRTAN